MKAIFILVLLSLVGCDLKPQPDEQMTPTRMADAAKLCERYKGLSSAEVRIFGIGNGWLLARCIDGTTIQLQPYQ